MELKGSGFDGTTSVTFGSRSAQFEIRSDSAISAVSPPGSGTVEIRTTNPNYTPKTSSVGRFMYLARPTVTSVTPPTGPAPGGTTVLVRGTGFVPGMHLLVGGQPAEAAHVRNPDALVAVMPAGYGTLAIRAVTPGGTSKASSRVTFSYRCRVLVIGDSLGIDLGWGFTSQLPGDALLSVSDLAVGSTGVVRWDFYDWPSKLRADLRDVRPQFVVALFGANDQQSIPTATGSAAVGTPAWDRAYGARVRLLTSIVTASGARLAWLGLPRMGPHSDVAAGFVAEVNRVDAAALRSVPRAAFASMSSLFTTTSGQYTPMVRLPNGAVALGRQPDEVHLTPDGATAIDAQALKAFTLFLQTRAH